MIPDSVLSALGSLAGLGHLALLLGDEILQMLLLSFQLGQINVPGLLAGGSQGVVPRDGGAWKIYKNLSIINTNF